MCERREGTNMCEQGAMCVDVNKGRGGNTQLEPLRCAQNEHRAGRGSFCGSALRMRA